MTESLPGGCMNARVLGLTLLLVSQGMAAEGEPPAPESPVSGAIKEPADGQNKTSAQPSPLAAAVAAAAGSAASSATERGLLLMATGTVTGGGMFSDLLSSGLWELGGSATLAGLPNPSEGFAIGVRARAGAQFLGNSPVGLAGATLVLGLVGARRDESFGYLLAGPGVKVLFGGDTRAHAALQLLGGVSLKGVALGAVVDYSYGQIGYLVSPSSSGFVALPLSGHVFQLGIEIGAGFLL